MDYRIYVEKLPRFRVEAQSLMNEFNLNLNLNLKNLRYINVYDLNGFTSDLLEKTKYSVFGEIVTDSVTDEIDLTGKKYIAVEYLPGQFDQRASSAVDCVKLVCPSADIIIKSSKLIILDDDADMVHLSSHLIKTDTYRGLGFHEYQKICDRWEIKG